MFFAGFCHAQVQGNESLKREVQHAVSKGVAFLAKKQEEDGRWGEENLFHLYQFEWYTFFDGAHILRESF